MEYFIVVFIILVVVSLLVTATQQRYSGPGEKADDRNREEFGEPVKSLYTSTEILTLHHRIEVTDETGKVVYRVETQFPSIHDKTDIYTQDGRHVSHFERKLFTIHEIHYVDMENGKHFVLSNELFHLIKDITNIEGLGWKLVGNFLQLNFTIRDAAGELIAVVSQKYLSIHDKYAVDIYKPEYEEEVITILIVLQHMIRDRESAESSGGAATAPAD